MKKIDLRFLCAVNIIDIPKLGSFVLQSVHR